MIFKPIFCYKLSYIFSMVMEYCPWDTADFLNDLSRFSKVEIPHPHTSLFILVSFLVTHFCEKLNNKTSWPDKSLRFKLLHYSSRWAINKIIVEGIYLLSKYVGRKEWLATIILDYYPTLGRELPEAQAAHNITKEWQTAKLQFPKHCKYIHSM